MIADGWNTARSLTLSNVSSITNTIDNGTTEANGWYAKRKGMLVLRGISLTSGQTSYNWGEAAADTTPDLVNSVRFSSIAGQAAGTATLNLVATDRTGLPTPPTGRVYRSLWSASTPTFTSATVQARYDLTSVGTESNLRLAFYRSGTWTVASDAPAADKTITVSSVTPFEYMAVVE